MQESSQLLVLSSFMTNETQIDFDGIHSMKYWWYDVRACVVHLHMTDFQRNNGHRRNKACRRNDKQTSINQKKPNKHQTVWSGVKTLMNDYCSFCNEKMVILDVIFSSLGMLVVLNGGSWTLFHDSSQLVVICSVLSVPMEM